MEYVLRNWVTVKRGGRVRSKSLAADGNPPGKSRRDLVTAAKDGSRAVRVHRKVRRQLQRTETDAALCDERRSSRFWAERAALTDWSAHQRATGRGLCRGRRVATGYAIPLLTVSQH